MVVRNYEQDDFDKVNKILFEAFHFVKSEDYEESNIYEIVCEMDGEVVGYLTITKIRDIIDGRYKYHIDNVCSDVSYRGKGVGTLLMNRVVEMAHKDDVKVIELTSKKERVEAHNLYKKFDFEIVDTCLFRRYL